MNGIQLDAAAVAVISIALLCLCGTPKRSKYLVTTDITEGVCIISVVKLDE